MTVNTTLGRYALGLGRQPAETDAAKRHRASILQKLQSHYGAVQFFRSGSFGNGTSVSGYSDVDYFAVINRDLLSLNSGRALAELAELLRERFPRTGVRVDSPGVRLPFGFDGNELSEVIPAYTTGRTQLGFRQFEMPDGDGGWMFAAPESHNDYVRTICGGLQGRVRPLIRLVKAWKFLRNVKIKSFYLEMYVTSYASNEGLILYDIDLERIFTRLRDGLLPAIIDPRFPDDGRKIHPCNTLSQWFDAYMALDRAVEIASAANAADGRGDVSDALHLWDRLFKWDLPIS